MEKNISEKDEEIQTLNLCKLEEKLKLTFDYEINTVKPVENKDLNCKMYYYDKIKKSYRIINYNSFNDELKKLPKIIPSKDPKKEKYNTSPFDKDFEEEEEENLDIKKEKNKKLKKANILKRLVSKQKIRYQNEEFDLDMAYITKRVIAMGFPSTGCETLYRNSLKDITNFFHKYHNDNVKIYNLCLEKDRIYNKSIFNKCEVGLFPATDHNPCPIKLILEFCIDICLYLIKNPNSVAAVHCKAGKGRTGVMICSYLIFSRLCESSEKAFRYYARVRTKDNTGVTIPSQKRYIKYFETFLEANFCPPYIFLIPKIIKSHFSHLIGENGRAHVTNILQSFKKEKSYFISANKFKFNGIKVGPLPQGKKLKLKICNFVNANMKLGNYILSENKESDDEENEIYYEIYFNPELIIHSDIKICISGGINFYIWVNLYYSSWETIKTFYDETFQNYNLNNILNEISNNKNEEEDSNEINTSKKNKKKEKNKIKDKRNEKLEMIKLKDENSVRSNSKLKGLLTDPSEYSNQTEDVTGKSLYEIIFKMKHNTNLNELISKINEGNKNKLNKNKLKITLFKDDLDKFEEAKKYPNISITLFYSLVDNE